MLLQIWLAYRIASTSAAMRHRAVDTLLGLKGVHLRHDERVIDVFPRRHATHRDLRKAACPTANGMMRLAMAMSWLALEPSWRGIEMVKSGTLSWKCVLWNGWCQHIHFYLYVRVHDVSSMYPPQVLRFPRFVFRRDEITMGVKMSISQEIWLKLTCQAQKNQTCLVG